MTAAFQYTFREDDLFPTGLVTTDLTAAFPALAEWIAVGRTRRPEPTSRRRRTPAPSSHSRGDARCTAHAPLRLRRVRELLQGPPAARRCSAATYERVPIDIFAGDTLTDAYAEINPLRETPVLELDSRRAAGAVGGDPVATSPTARRSCPRTRSSARRSRSGCRSSRSGHGRARQPALPAADGPRPRAGARGTARHRPRRARGARRAPRRPRVRRRRRRRRSPTSGSSRTSASPATRASTHPPRRSAPGSIASARCPASSTTSSPIRTTRGPALALDLRRDDLNRS